MAQAGVKVGLSARRSSELERVSADIEAQGGTSLVLPTDLRERDQIATMIERTTKTFGGLDILINNAGFGHWEPIVSADIDAWQNEIESNLQGVMFATRFAVDVMIEQGSGHIVNVSSLVGVIPAQDGLDIVPANGDLLASRYPLPVTYPKKEFESH